MCFVYDFVYRKKLTCLLYFGASPSPGGAVPSSPKPGTCKLFFKSVYLKKNVCYFKKKAKSNVINFYRVLLFIQCAFITAGGDILWFILTTV